MPPRLVGAAVARLAAELRRLTDELFGLPDDHVDFVLLDGPWPHYAICYPKGLALARRFVGGDPARFERLLREELRPPDLTV